MRWEPASPRPDNRTLAYWLLLGLRPRRLKQSYARSPRMPWVLREAKRTARRQILDSKRQADEYVYRYYRLALESFAQENFTTSVQKLMKA